VVRSGILLLARPLIPPPIRPLLAFYGALPIFKKGLAALRRRELNVDVLDASAVGAAMATRDFLTASLISFLLKLGEYLDAWTRCYSRRLLSEMFHTTEEWAWVERNGEDLRLPLEEVIIGDIVIVRTGSLIPVDGVVLDGEAMVNQSSLTGESLAVLRRKGASVYAGTAVEEGLIRVRTVLVGDQTRAARVVKIIEEAETLKAESQSRSEAMAERIVPYSFLLSGLVLLVTRNPTRAAAVLLVDFSCAIKLSTPLVILSSLARAARHRVLVKGGKYLELLSKVDAFVLDKTGTLTEATPEVADVIAFNGHSREFVLRHTACVEEHFPHPVATAVVREAARQGLRHDEEHSEVEYIVAHGIATQIQGKRVVVGSRHFVQDDEGVDIEKGEKFLTAFARKGNSVLYMAIGGELAGLIAIHDPVRSEARAFIEGLKDLGIRRIVMVTGDNRETAATIARELGIDEFYAQALPDQKVEIIRALQREGCTVAMVGDGINDSPALSCADVGISMKHGSDIAREACDILLQDGALDDILQARKISREAMELVDQNFRTIVTVNSAALFLSVAGVMPPVFAASLHNLSTIVVGVRALDPLRKSIALPQSLA
jgi:Cu2+-exporting ATPase